MSKKTKAEILKFREYHRIWRIAHGIFPKPPSIMSGLKELVDKYKLKEFLPRDEDKPND